MAKKSKSSRRWLKEHRDDFFVKKSKQEGLRSRASFKLREVQEKHRLIQPGMCVVDLGAAPGGWSELAADWVGRRGLVVGLDLLPIVPLDLEQAVFLQGDFTEQTVYQQLMQQLDGRAVDVVLSDMAPNLSGIRTADQAQAMGLCELALYFAEQTLKPGGHLLVKVFHGAGFDEFYRDLKQRFSKVITIKPKASRSRSKETYLLAQGAKNLTANTADDGNQ